MSLCSESRNFLRDPLQPQPGTNTVPSSRSPQARWGCLHSPAWHPVWAQWLSLSDVMSAHSGRLLALPPHQAERKPGGGHDLRPTPSSDGSQGSCRPLRLQRGPTLAGISQLGKYHSWVIWKENNKQRVLQMEKLVLPATEEPGGSPLGRLSIRGGH